MTETAGLPECDCHPSIIKEAILRPDINPFKLTISHENIMEEARICKREKYEYLNLTKELGDAGYRV